MLELILFLVLYFYDFFFVYRDEVNFPQAIRPGNRRAAEEIIASGINSLSLSINFIQMIHLGF